MSGVEIRSAFSSRLRMDLLGPGQPEEEIRDRPSDRYLTGILYSAASALPPDQDDGLGNDGEGGEADEDPGDDVPLIYSNRPSIAGVSFALECPAGTEPAADIRVRCGTYRLVYRDTNGDISKEPRREFEAWKREDHDILITRERLYTHAISLANHGLDDVEVFLQVARSGAAHTVTTVLVNRRAGGNTRADGEQSALFQTELAVRPLPPASLIARSGSVEPRDEDDSVAALIYRDVRQYSVGHTCSSTWAPERKPEWVLTDWCPVAVVPAVSDRGDPVFRQVEERNPATFSTSALARADARILNSSLTGLTDAYESWIGHEEARIKEGAIPGPLVNQAHRNIERCGSGLRRMQEAIALLQSDAEVLQAFRLANQAMQIQRQWRSGEADLIWRPFQLGFQLLSLPSLASPDHPDRKCMDLLWFPTGGGKTEAYLGLTAFILFLRRLREPTGRGAGVSVLMRYTLRLLTIQQFQRAAATVLACELIRRQGGGAGRLGNQPFGIGLWVGGGATPNDRRHALPRETAYGTTPGQLKECPCCREQLSWNRTMAECRPYCRNQDCDLSKSGSALPVWTVDQEIYENAPSLVIGTSDKFAQIVRKPETGVLFGLGHETLPPDLIIQDELHLISGPLGTLAALYEIAIDELCSRRGRCAKVIGSTATIRRAEDQIRALFNRSTYQFPSPGLDASNSGFAAHDQSLPGRLYVGVTTAGRSPKYTLQAVAAATLQAANNPSWTDEQRDPYWTLVGYFNSLRELGGSLVLMLDDVPVSIRQFATRHAEQPRPISVPAELTSRVPSEEIPGILRDLERRAGETGAYDVVLASNMISVGVDIPRLGLMIVSGQPKTLAEYIQATSRVGRGTVPGVVATLYYNSRARDRSRYETFRAWHGALYREVESSSVTPFASRAQDKALHAVLVALVRHLIPSLRDGPVIQDDHVARVEGLAAKIVERAGVIDTEEATHVAAKVAALIAEWRARPDLASYWDDFGRQPTLLISAEQNAAIMSAAGGIPVIDGLPRAVWPAPNSLRDVEPGVPFKLVSRLRR